MKLKLKQFVSASATIFIVLLSAKTFAYRTDHGVLPEGTSTCDAHVPVTLEIPDNAKAIPDPFKGEFSDGFYHVEQLKKGLFYMTDGAFQAMFLVSKKGIILVDAPPSIGFNPIDPASSVSILDVIYSVPEAQGKPIKKLIYSHSPMDHIGAASLIKDAFPNVQIIAHKETKRRLARGMDNRIQFLPGTGALPPPMPSKTFNKRMRVRLGGQVLKLSYHGPVHEPGNIFIYAPKQKVLMLVDVIFPGWAPFNDLALADDVPLYIKAHEIALSFGFKTFIGGHVNRLGSRVDVASALEYINDIKANATSALFDPGLFAVFGVLPTHALGALGIYLDQVACSCANTTLDKDLTPSARNWLGQIGAADINTVGHCWAMIESLRVDP